LSVIATTDDPHYVVGVMMDNPARNADGSPGHSAAPLFHNICRLAAAIPGRR
jgi:cell division protein FtsI (penicillin-binding protein 3)